MSPRPRDEASLLTVLSRIFNEAVMGFLALVALATALGPMVFDVSPGVERLLTVVEWTLVIAFAAEFVIQGAVADDRQAWLQSPWRVVDLVTILGPIVALLPQVSDFASGSLMLRVLRVGRAVAFGTRVGSVVARRRVGSRRALHARTPTVYVVNDGELRATESDWKSCLAWAREPDGSWFHATNLDPDRFTELAHAAGVSDRELQRALAPDGAAMIRQELRHTALILQVPAVADTGFPEVERDRFFAIVGDRGLLTASTGTGDLKGLVLSQLADVPNLPFPAKIVSALLAAIRECNLRVAQRFNDEQLRLETIEGGHVFLQDTFRLRREISTTALDLWHFKNAVRALADGKVRLGGVDLKNEKFLDDLVMEAESLYETVNGSKEEVQTLIELHINVKSFEMNKFLKVLAVVSFLGLIPSVVGGLLGMNVAGNPWPVTLGHVAFGVAMTMATSLYVFAVKGWLR